VKPCEVRGLVALALAQLDAGRIAEAKATMEQRLKVSPDRHNDPNFAIAYVRVLLADGRGAEAIEPLRDTYGNWLSMQPNSVYAAEALYWFGRAYLAAGDKRGRWMVEQARQALAKSPISTHRALAQHAAT
jgi:hypothetical protein